ncbi:uncharacterized protein [Bemisia tabaci]|uniref:uncharacterized protein n=1 Tax=Bemisia tabaci TaxID=7038 RepID=UPI003B27BA91
MMELVFTLKRTALLLLLTVPHILSTDDQLIEDQVGINPDLEFVHLYFGQWPVGIAVSANGRKFSCFTAGLDANNTNDGQNGAFQVAELTGFETETAYPSVEINNPPGGSIDFSTSPPVTKGLSNYLLGVMSVVIDFEDRLWVLDTGRVLLDNNMLPASPGGTKLISVDLATDTVTRTYVFPTSVARPTSCFGDVRFDTQRGFAYITDSNAVFMNALVVLDLNTGESWRVLEKDRSVSPRYGYVPFVWGDSMYQVEYDASGTPIDATFMTFGVEGVALSPTLDTLYYSVLGDRFLFSVPTAILRNRNSTLSEIASYVRNLGEKGFSADIATDSKGKVYGGHAEQDGVFVFDPETQIVALQVHDKRINFAYAFSVGTDGYLYFTVNQLNYLGVAYPGRGPLGVDRRQRPFACFRIKLPGGAIKGPGS